MVVEIVVLPDDVGWLEGFFDLGIDASKLDLVHRGKIVVGLFGLHGDERCDRVAYALLIVLLINDAPVLASSVCHVLLDPTGQLLVQDIQLLPLLPFDIVTLLSEHVKHPGVVEREVDRRYSPFSPSSELLQSVLNLLGQPQLQPQSISLSGHEAGPPVVPSHSLYLFYTEVELHSVVTRGDCLQIPHAFLDSDRANTILDDCKEDQA